MSTKYRSKFFPVFLIAGLVSSGCYNDNTTDASFKAGSISADAAYSIAVATGEKGGGMSESFSDLLNVLSRGKISPTMTMTGGDFVTVLSDNGKYESSTGWWTINITRTHSYRVTSFERRSYQYRFRKNSTQYQQYYVVNGDTAETMEFKIVSGSGYFKDPGITHRLTQLSGKFLVTNINEDMVTITLEDDYVRSGVDSIVTRQATRALLHTVTVYKDNIQIQTLRFHPTNLKPLANWRNDLHTAISGTMHGHIFATATVSNEDYYKGQTIDQDFAVTLTRGNGEGLIELELDGNSQRFRFNLRPDDGN